MPVHRLVAFLAAAVVAGVAVPVVSATAADDPFGRAPPPGVRPVGPSAAVPDDDSKPPDVAAYRAWLARDDWLCRALAARELAPRFEDGAVAALSSTLAKETEPRVLGTLLKSLAARRRIDLLAEGGVALVDRLVALLAHPHAGVRARALVALEPLPPVRLPPDASAMQRWWARGRDGLAVEAGFAIERREAERAAVRGAGPALPLETKTVAPLAMRRYGDLERMQREGLEVVVCLDSTGSMGAVIDAAKASIVDLARRLRDLAPRFRIGLVTYDDGAEVRLALTSDATQLEREFRRVHADGGGDVEEGVDKAILLAFEQRRVAWSRKAMRVILVVGDAPPHEEDVAPLLRAIGKRRDDPLFESPVRIDTISTSPGAGPSELVPHFEAIAVAGHGSALWLASTRQLAAELLLAPFGPQWREPLRLLLADLDAFERGH